MWLLLIATHPGAAAALAAPLEAGGHAVSVASSAGFCLSGVLGSPFDVVVVDEGQPGSDGRDLVRGLRQAGLSCPLLLLAASTDPSDEVAGLDAGADDYLVKPVTPELLSARVRVLARIQRRAWAW